MALALLSQRRRAKVLSYLLLAGGLQLGCGAFHQQDSREEDEARREDRTEEQLVDLARRHNADREWDKSFPDRAARLLYTVDFQEALIKADGRPVVLTGRID